ncbi:hypothetical protein [Brevifollis gellanilyticus]|uniref:hypothetical protein n=1 Tax=Brevifollis gellanilyticus TaxID=748831 RepID=UPI0011BE0986|nr:hypothetical protein [Brevifollis gellanilyticus]
MREVDAAEAMIGGEASLMTALEKIKLPMSPDQGSLSPIEDELPTTVRHAPRDSLQDAASHLRTCLRTDGSSHGEDDFDRPENEWAAFRAWAETHGLILPLDFHPPERDGGREHDVRHDEGTGLWWKYTKPNLAGYTVSWTEGRPWLHNALPLDYLQRMIWQNHLFGDEVRLIGLWNPQGHDWRIVTTQPHVQGQKATLEELEHALIQAGFEVLPWRGLGYADSLSVRKDGFDVWDIHPANVLLTDSGLPLPFDVMITCTPGVSANEGGI